MSDPKYSLSTAILQDGTEQFVVSDRDDRLHVSSSWLQFLSQTHRSPHTVRSYGSRVAWYLSWTSLTTDWRSVTIAHFAMWRGVLASRHVNKTNGEAMFRSEKTINLWMTPLRSFYDWADAEGLLTNDVASRMTQLRYFPPGSPAGGEHGMKRRVLVPELRPKSTTEDSEPAWIDSAAARQELINLPLNARDRFLVDLMYFTGIRAGEALSLFTSDMHFGGGSPALGCREADPHFHVRLDNPVENKARAKGKARLLYVNEALIDRYIDYMLERNLALSEAPQSPHVFVNMYCDSRYRGRAMTYNGVKKLIARCAQGIGYELTGPHMLRHTFATRQVRGIECEAQKLDVVQALMGHASISSTMVYSHGLEPAKKAALKSVQARSVDLRREA